MSSEIDELKEITKRTTAMLFGDTGKLVPLREALNRHPMLRGLGRAMRVGWYDTHATV